MNLWPDTPRAALQALIDRHAHSGAFAVFDMDNTCWQHDLTEALLPWLEARGALTRDTLDPALRIIPFDDRFGPESLISFYHRLAAISDLIANPWLAQSFAGLTLTRLRAEIDAMLAHRAPLPVTLVTPDGPRAAEVRIPRPFAAMRQLWAALREAGIAVWAVTAASEEAVRAVACNPARGYHLPEARVLGVNVLLRDRAGRVSTSQLDLRAGLPLTDDRTLTATLVSPMTWNEGKWGTILGWIDPWRRPVLVAGDTPHSDGLMLLKGPDPEAGGLRLWVDRGTAAGPAMAALAREAAAAQEGLRLTADAERGWLQVRAADLAPEDF